MADERFVIEFVVDDNGAMRVLDRYTRSQDRAKESTARFGAAMGAAVAAGTLLADAIRAGVTAALRLAVNTFRDAIAASQQFHNTFIGLTTVANKFGIAAGDVREAALALANDGLLGIDEAAAGLKNLLASGFGLPEAIQLMEGFKDSASFNRQASLEFGQAVVSATEGIKNQNSILVDNAGLTKNLSVIMKEAGLSVADLAKVSSDAGVRAKFLGGLMKELGLFSGDAARLTETYSGAVSRLDTQWTKALAKLGSAVTENEDVAAAINTATDELEEFIDTLDDRKLRTFVSDVLAALRLAFETLGPIVSFAASAMENYLAVTNRGFVKAQAANRIIGDMNRFLDDQRQALDNAAFSGTSAADAMEEFASGQRRLSSPVVPAVTAEVTKQKDVVKELEAAYRDVSIAMPVQETLLWDEALQSAGQPLAVIGMGTVEWGEALKGIQGDLTHSRDRVFDFGVEAVKAANGVEQLQKEMEKAGDEALTFGQKLSGVFRGVADDLNRVFQAAFEGGGGLGGAVQSLATNLAEGLLSMIPVIGPAISKFAGAIVSGFKKLFGSLFGGPSEAELQARDMVTAFRDEIIAGLSDDQLAEAAAAGFANSMDAALVVGVRDMFVAAGLTAEEGEAAVQALWDAIKNGGPEAVTAAIANIQLVEAEVKRLEEAEKAQREAHLAGLQAMRSQVVAGFEEQRSKFRQMEEAAEKYGISLHSLGPQFKRAKIDEIAQGLIADFDLLTQNGANVDAVIRGMAPSVNEVVQQAIKFGTSVPENMRPLLEKMIEAGELTDDQGVKFEDLSQIKFAKSPTEQFQDMITKIDEMIEAITGPGGLIEALNSIPDKTISISTDTSGVDTGAVPEFPGGGIVPGAGGHRLVYAEPGEFVLRREAVNRLGVDRVRQLNGGGGVTSGGGDINIDLRGSVISNDQALDDLAEAINERAMAAVGDRKRLNVVT